MFKSILIANRGEIACRLIKSARRLGIKTYAVYSEADKHSLHTKEADVAVCIGQAESKKSYLNIKRIIEVALENKTDNDVQTPNLDSLAKSGIELNRHYSFKFCSPSFKPSLNWNLSFHRFENGLLFFCR
mgnify:CR=1 FL=1